jgi:hypothetical protein
VASRYKSSDTGDADIPKRNHNMLPLSKNGECSLFRRVGEPYSEGNRKKHGICEVQYCPQFQAPTWKKSPANRRNYCTPEIG